MIESAFQFAYTQILGLSLITYLGAITFILVLTALIMSVALSRNRINPVTSETVSFFAIVILALYAILNLLLLL